MRLNVSKCAVVTFHRSADPVMIEYKLCGTVLPRKTQVKDLDVIFSADLRPEKHIDHICNRASRTLGFIIRTSRNGLSTKALMSLYTALIRSILEYCCVVWAPYQVDDTDRLEKIQRRFLRIIGVRLGYDFMAAPVDTIAESLGLLSLSVRRQLADAVFLRKLLTGQVDCDDLLSRISFRIPGSTRSRDLFFPHQYSTTYAYHSCLPRLQRRGNALSSGLGYDFFFDSELALRRLFKL
ncbi:uncharacterized protein LOC124358286 [Homalodisca vitripennis]|uniref:uncharacterized protein LOC124358286 n=1 Tax=Homalodisca vitripennis TaxID=197043 RepID=UPI001EEA0BAA|nr:uncharacterized protein LOC124358286 [Homalodisca vitripennis]